jgi:dipeptidase
MIVGKSASIDGSVLCSHTADGGGTLDARLVYVPAKDWKQGDMRPIFESPENYPRYVGYERGIEAYYPEYCEDGSTHCKNFKSMGSIPQVPHTFAYFESTYGIMNEKQVGIAESTCSSVFMAQSISAGGKALFSIDELSRIALERASSSREAVQLMGDLATAHGFYGASNSFEGGAENLMVVDKDEGFVFHITPDPTGASAVWVAARVPDDSVAVVANMFVVREVNLTDSENFLGRQDMWELAQAQGLWSPGQPKDWTKTFSDGEYAHKYYSGRRIWGAFRRLAPFASAQLGLGPDYIDLKESAPYPFTVKLGQKDKAVSAKLLMDINRDWYEGTEFSTGDSNLAGGAFGSAVRYSGGKNEYYEVDGNWERTIMLHRTSSSIVLQARRIKGLSDDRSGVVWFGPHSPLATSYTPLVLALGGAPAGLADAWQGRYSEGSNFHAHRLVANILQIKFDNMVQDLRLLQDQQERNGAALVAPERLLAERGAPEAALDALRVHVVRVRSEFHQLVSTLLFTYADGYVNYFQDGAFVSSSEGYPKWWLQNDAVGYTSGPPPVDVARSRLGRFFRDQQDKVMKENQVDQFTKQARELNIAVISRSAGSDRVQTQCPSSSLKVCILTRCKEGAEASHGDSSYRACIDKCVERC